MKLAVELYDALVGHLRGDDSRTFDVEPTAEGIERFGLNSRVLSTQLPLTPRLPRQHAERRRNWFRELLPEGDQLDYMLLQSSLRRGDTLGFLARYGRDVAGAVQIWDEDDPTEPQTPSTSEIDPAGIRHLLENPTSTPLGNAPRSGKTSLQGVQPKIVLVRTPQGWAQAHGGFPSTHILKPRLTQRPELIFDEEYGSRLVRRLGLADHGVEVQDFAGLPTLVIQRHDRADGARIHQEDLNQALGAAGNQKYQELGGVVTLSRIADVIERHGESQDLQRLGKMAVAAAAVGNLDMHAKNISLLHQQSGEIRLAPAYDFVPLAQHPEADGRMALAVNNKYRLRDITGDDLVSELRKWGLRHAQQQVDDTLTELASAVAEESPLDGASQELQEKIRGNSLRLLETRTA